MFRRLFGANLRLFRYYYCFGVSGQPGFIAFATDYSALTAIAFINFRLAKFGFRNYFARFMGLLFLAGRRAGIPQRMRRAVFIRRARGQVLPAAAIFGRCLLYLHFRWICHCILLSAGFIPGRRAGYATLQRPVRLATPLPAILVSSLYCSQYLRYQPIICFQLLQFPGFSSIHLSTSASTASVPGCIAIIFALLRFHSWHWLLRAGPAAAGLVYGRRDPFRIRIPIYSGWLAGNAIAIPFASIPVLFPFRTGINSIFAAAMRILAL